MLCNRVVIAIIGLVTLAQVVVPFVPLLEACSQLRIGRTLCAGIALIARCYIAVDDESEQSHSSARVAHR